jgi:hypothetical protein
MPMKLGDRLVLKIKRGRYGEWYIHNGGRGGQWADAPKEIADELEKLAERFNLIENS